MTKMQQPYNSATALMGIYPRKINLCAHNNLLMNVFSSFVYDRWELETIEDAL